MRRSPEKRRLSRRSFAASGGAILTGIVFIQAPARPAQFAWKCGNSIGPTHPLNVRLTEAFAKILAETKGDVDIKNYPANALGGFGAMAAQLRLGALEIMAGTGDAFDAQVPIATMDTVPFAFANYDVAHRAFDGSLGALIRAALLAKGIFVFERVSDSGFRQFTTSTKPIRVVDDLQGVKLRVTPSRFRLDVFRSLGASPAAIDVAEVYTALQTHLVDGVENPLSGIEDFRFFEVQKYCSVSNHMWGAFITAVNGDKWKSLPPLYQTIVRKHVNAGAMLMRSDFQVLEKNVRERLASHGLIFNDVERESFRTKLRSTGFYQRWRAEWGTVAWSELEKYTGPLA